VRNSPLCRGEFGLDEVAPLPASNESIWREYRLFAEEVATARPPEWGCRGESVEGVYWLSIGPNES